MNITRLAVFVAVWAIAALIGYYQDWGIVLAGVFALPLWLLWVFGSDSRTSGAYGERFGSIRSFGDSLGRSGRRRQNRKLWGLILTVIGLALLWWSPEAPYIYNWIAIGFGLAGVIGGFALACSGWRKVMGIFAVGVVIMCMGYVPHPEYRYVSPYRAYDYSPYGVKVIRSHFVDKEGRPLYGLADRYGTILEPDYVNFYLLDRRQPFLAIDNGTGIGVYDIERHEIVVPIEENCLKVEQTGDKRYQMTDSTGRAFAELELPKAYHRERVDSRITVKPFSHSSDEPEALLVPVGPDKIKNGVFPRRQGAGGYTSGGYESEGEQTVTNQTGSPAGVEAAETPSEISEGQGHQ